MKIVFASLEKLDFKNTLEKVCIVELIEQLKKKPDDYTTYVLATSEEQLKALENRDCKVYVPSDQLVTTHRNQGWYVYFDLENYPFYQKVKEIIRKENSPKGVFRFRRTVKSRENPSILVSDLYVLSSLLGEPQDIQVKQTDSLVQPSHTIIMMNFGDGTMAHVEYTVSNQERIELEWSGIKNIIEFDSKEMNSIRLKDKTSLSLTYSIDTIITTAHKVDEELLDRLNYLNKLINGGAYL